MSVLHWVLSIFCLALVLVPSTAVSVPISRIPSSLTPSSLLDTEAVQAAHVGVTGSSALSASSDDPLGADNSSTGTDVSVDIGVGQAFITLAIILVVVGAVMGAVWYRHRQRDGAAPFSFSLPSFGRSRTHGSGAVGGGANNERLLGGPASDDGGLLRNRPGGHSLV